MYTNHCFDPLFLAFLLNSPYVNYQKSVVASGDIIVHISAVKLSSILVALPPANEQIRIVSAIKKTLPLIREYGNYQSSLNILDTGINEKLKKSILQYAIQGKLVPQDPSDEPASFLLERIRVEKEQLIKDGKIKRDKNESYIYRGSDNSYYEKFADGHEICIDEELPFEIPDTWMWCRLRSICNFGTNATVESSAIDSDDWVLDLEDIQKETGILQSKMRKYERSSKSTKHCFQKGNVLFSKLRPYLNKVIVADENGYCTSEILALDFGKYIDSEYAKLFLMSPEFVNYTVKCSYGVKMPRLGTDDGKNALFPLSPINEQCQIIIQRNILFNMI